MTDRLTARSPAKLILSGEHAVVYGAPALALAVNRYAESIICKRVSRSIFFNLLNLDYARSLTLNTLREIKKQLQNKYHAFLEGRCHISDVLKKPFELLQFTVTNLIEKVNPVLAHGFEIHTASNIPMGCGMGSSAAAVMSTVYALIHYFQLDLDPVRFLNLGREAENLQHGRSSGLDLYLAMKGGCVHFQNGQAKTLSLPDFPLMIVHTGTPVSSTGACVSHAAEYFKKDAILREFEAITLSMEKAFLKKDLPEMMEAVRENHRALCAIGVVPERVQTFIESIEKAGGAAKICGAGAVMGDKGGVVLVVAPEDLSHIAMHFGYKVDKVVGDDHGTRLV